MKKILSLSLILTACAVSQPPVQTSVVYPNESVSVSALAAAINCPAPSITWSVSENIGPSVDAGTVDANGNYSAPGCGSPFLGTTVHVVASGCGKSASAAVALSQRVNAVDIAYAVVTSGGTSCLAADPHNVTVTPGDTIQFYSSITRTCGVDYSPSLPGTWPPAC